MTDASIPSLGIKLLKQAVSKSLEMGAQSLYFKPQADILLINYVKNGKMSTAFVAPPSAGRALLKALSQHRRLRLGYQELNLEFSRSNNVWRLDISRKPLLPEDLRELSMTDGSRQTLYRLLANTSGLIIIASRDKHTADNLAATLLRAYDTTEKHLAVVGAVWAGFPNIDFQTGATVGRLKTDRIIRQTIAVNPDAVYLSLDELPESAGRLLATADQRLILARLPTDDALTAAKLLDKHLGRSPVKRSAIIRLAVKPKNCSACSAPHRPDAGLLAELTERLGLFNGQLENASFAAGAGCPACGHTGQQGHLHLLEILDLSACPADEAGRQVFFADPPNANLTETALQEVLNGRLHPEELLTV